MNNFAIKQFTSHVYTLYFLQAAFFFIQDWPSPTFLLPILRSHFAS